MKLYAYACSYCMIESAVFDGNDVAALAEVREHADYSHNGTADVLALHSEVVPREVEPANASRSRDSLSYGTDR